LIHHTTYDHLLFPVAASVFKNRKTTASVLRLDKMDPVVSGNKWFKLKYQIRDARAMGCREIVSYGGVWSNHILATAAACNSLSLQSRAYIRNDEKNRSGMDASDPEKYFIPEGGLSALGVQGAAEILQLNGLKKFTHILCAVGTGTSFAGLVNAALPHQKIIGINCLKGGSFQLPALTPFLKQQNFEIYNDYHFGGFAKMNSDLIQLMNQWYSETGIPSDFVYTGKLFFGLTDLLQKGRINENANLLLIHSGGLQGNRSLENGILRF
jgi:1-aminocyclopropane-1-carboxylate deaminase/D-cysteine desulfhydrase-like pyridoxal-dependent ACC family enzyme